MDAGGVDRVADGHGSAQRTVVELHAGVVPPRIVVTGGLGSVARIRVCERFHLWVLGIQEHKHANEAPEVGGRVDEAVAGAPPFGGEEFGSDYVDGGEGTPSHEEKGSGEQPTPSA